MQGNRKIGVGGCCFQVDFPRTDRAADLAAYRIPAWPVGNPGGIKPAPATAPDREGPELVDLIARLREDADAPVTEWVAR